MNSVLKQFFDWYERHKKFHTVVTALLFLTQLVHLYWLGFHVIALRLGGEALFNPSPFWESIIIIVDYFEIPAIISASFLYINDLRLGFQWKPVLLLLFLNSQWLHLFWITDEFVQARFTGDAAVTLLPVWLAWTAILIDYLELPVIFDTIKRSIIIMKQRLTSRQKTTL